MKLSEKAFEIAKKAHAGQKDKAGVEYILHPMTVASKMHTDVERAVAYLHDVVEDTNVSLSDLCKAGMTEEIVRAVDAITKREGEPYDSYILRLSQNPLAVKVKIADMEHNSDISRIKNPTREDIERSKKYKAKILVLKSM